MMSGFISVPMDFRKDGTSVSVIRPLGDRVSVIDNLVELVVFTPRGSFPGDPDFGFEYWNHEYANVHFRDFNVGHTTGMGVLCNDTTKRICQESVRRSLEVYEPSLKNVDVSIELNGIGQDAADMRISSRYEVSVKVTGVLEDGLGVLVPYRKNVSFFMEPTVRPINI